MFGGFGIYCGGVFFAIVYRGNLYFRTGEETRAAYEEKGMRPFAPRAGQVLKTYYQVPSEVLDRVPELIAWARAALGAAGKAPPPRTGFTAPRRV
jgi:DNA transformation protein